MQNFSKQSPAYCRARSVSKRCNGNQLYSLTRCETAKKASWILYFARRCCRLNARRYVRNRLLNNFLRRLLTSSVHFSSPQKAPKSHVAFWGPPLGTAPEQKTKSAKTAQLCGFSAFNVFYFLECKMLFCLRKIAVYFSAFLRAVQPAFSTVSSPAYCRARLLYGKISKGDI